MRSSLLRLAPIAALLVLGACTTLPTGPSVLVLPGTGKTYDQFRLDDMDCRQFASDQAGDPNRAATSSGVRSAALGAGLGALAGAAIDGRSGAAVGLGTGAAIGGLAGTSTGTSSAYGVQRRYDFAYQQCMYAKGHRIPVSGNFTSAPPANTPPPPPPGNPPPPPPGYAPPPGAR
jgi:hypothetical protein